MKRVWSLLVLAALNNACDSGSASEPAPAPTPQAAPSAPAPAPEPAPAAPANVEAPAEEPAAEEPATTDARVLAIRERYAEIEADPGLTQQSFEHKCPGDEGGAAVRLFAKEGVVHKAEVDVTMPGHGADSYALYYDKGKVVFALYTMTGWSFTEGGTPEKPATKDSVTEYRYYFADKKPVSCLKKRAEGPTEQIKKLVRQAPNQPDDCARAAKAQKLANVVSKGEKAQAELGKLVCL